MVPDDWQTFHDPFGLYTVRIPPEWYVEGGSPEPGYEGHHFNCDNHFWVFIAAWPMDDYTRPICVNTFLTKPRPLFHGYPALPMPCSNFDFVTHDAKFKISYHPGFPTEEQKRLIDAILGTFTPMNPEQLEVT
jgi:hypothetical protein